MGYCLQWTCIQQRVTLSDRPTVIAWSSQFVCVVHDGAATNPWTPIDNVAQAQAALAEFANNGISVPALLSANAESQGAHQPELYMAKVSDVTAPVTAVRPIDFPQTLEAVNNIRSTFFDGLDGLTAEQVYYPNTEFTPEQSSRHLIVQSIGLSQLPIPLSDQVLGLNRHIPVDPAHSDPDDIILFPKIKLEGRVLTPDNIAPIDPSNRPNTYRCTYKDSAGVRLGVAVELIVANAITDANSSGPTINYRTTAVDWWRLRTELLELIGGLWSLAWLRGVRSSDTLRELAFLQLGFGQMRGEAKSVSGTKVQSCLFNIIDVEALPDAADQKSVLSALLIGTLANQVDIKALQKNGNIHSELSDAFPDEYFKDINPDDFLRDADKLADYYAICACKLAKIKVPHEALAVPIAELYRSTGKCPSGLWSELGQSYLLDIGMRDIPQIDTNLNRSLSRSLQANDFGEVKSLVRSVMKKLADAAGMEAEGQKYDLVKQDIDQALEKLIKRYVTPSPQNPETVPYQIDFPVGNPYPFYLLSATSWLPDKATPVQDAVWLERNKVIGAMRDQAGADFPKLGKFLSWSGPGRSPVVVTIPSEAPQNDSDQVSIQTTGFQGTDHSEDEENPPGQPSDTLDLEDSDVFDYQFQWKDLPQLAYGFYYRVDVMGLDVAYGAYGLADYDGDHPAYATVAAVASGSDPMQRFLCATPVMAPKLTITTSTSKTGNGIASRFFDWHWSGPSSEKPPLAILAPAVDPFVKSATKATIGVTLPVCPPRVLRHWLQADLILVKNGLPALTPALRNKTTKEILTLINELRRDLKTPHPALSKLAITVLNYDGGVLAEDTVALDMNNWPKVVEPPEVSVEAVVAIERRLRVSGQRVTVQAVAGEMIKVQIAGVLDERWFEVSDKHDARLQAKLHWDAALGKRMLPAGMAMVEVASSKALEIFMDDTNSTSPSYYKTVVNRSRDQIALKFLPGVFHPAGDAKEEIVGFERSRQYWRWHGHPMRPYPFMTESTELNSWLAEAYHSYSGTEPLKRKETYKNTDDEWGLDEDSLPSTCGARFIGWRVAPVFRYAPLFNKKYDVWHWPRLLIKGNLAQCIDPLPLPDFRYAMPILDARTYDRVNGALARAPNGVMLGFNDVSYRTDSLSLTGGGLGDAFQVDIVPEEVWAVDKESRMTQAAHGAIAQVGPNPVFAIHDGQQVAFTPLLLGLAAGTTFDVGKNPLLNATLLPVFPSSFGQTLLHDDNGELNEMYDDSYKPSHWTQLHIHGRRFIRPESEAYWESGSLVEIVNNDRKIIPVNRPVLNKTTATFNGRDAFCLTLSFPLNRDPKKQRRVVLRLNVSETQVIEELTVANVDIDVATKFPRELLLFDPRLDVALLPTQSNRAWLRVMFTPIATPDTKKWEMIAQVLDIDNVWQSISRISHIDSWGWVDREKTREVWTLPATTLSIRNELQNQIFARADHLIVSQPFDAGWVTLLPRIFEAAGHTKADIEGQLKLVMKDGSLTIKAPANIKITLTTQNNPQLRTMLLGWSYKKPSEAKTVSDHPSAPSEFHGAYWVGEDLSLSIVGKIGKVTERCDFAVFAVLQCTAEMKKDSIDSFVTLITEHYLTEQGVSHEPNARFAHLSRVFVVETN